METTVTLGQLLTIGIGILGAVLLFWNNTNVRIKVLEMKVQMHDDIVAKFEQIKDAIHNLDMKISSKADRDEKQH